MTTCINLQGGSFFQLLLQSSHSLFPYMQKHKGYAVSYFLEGKGWGHRHCPVWMHMRAGQTMSGILSEVEMVHMVSLRLEIQ